MLPLPPAYYDPTLDVGGEDVKARKVESRLTVQVLVNGRGPYNFIVDSGADTSVIGLRIARGLQLPLGTPAILNSMTSPQHRRPGAGRDTDARPEHDPEPSASGAARIRRRRRRDDRDRRARRSSG